ncbi:MAG: hypothetical protein AAF492_10440 [Verrucomicrobiota bacterium]
MIFRPTIFALTALCMLAGSAPAIPVQVEVTGVGPEDVVMLALTPEEKSQPRSARRIFEVPGGKGEVEVPVGIAYEVHIACEGFGSHTIHSIMFDENFHRIEAHLVKNLSLEGNMFDVVEPALTWAAQIDLVYQYSSANGDIDDGHLVGFDCKARSPDSNPGFRRLGRPHVVFGLRVGQRDADDPLDEVDSQTFSFGLGAETMIPDVQLGPWLPGLSYGIRFVYTHFDSDGVTEDRPFESSDSLYGLSLNAGLLFAHAEIPEIGIEIGGEWVLYGDEADLGPKGTDQEWNGLVRFQIKKFF